MLKLDDVSTEEHHIEPDITDGLDKLITDSQQRPKIRRII